MTSTMEKQNCRTGECNTPMRSNVSVQNEFSPYVNIIEDVDQYQISLDIPGTSTDQIDINFENNLLEIHAKVEQRHIESNNKMILCEYKVGDFYREFRIGEGIDVTDIQANYKNGVLILTLPKAANVKPQKITVKGE